MRSVRAAMAARMTLGADTEKSSRWCSPMGCPALALARYG